MCVTDTHASGTVTKTNTAIVIPVFNETGSLKAVLADIKQHVNCDIFVVDDASTDESVQLAKESGVQVIPLAINLGAWNAIQTGMRFALKQDYKVVITMDADGQHQASEIEKLIAAANGSPQSQVIIGACPRRGSELRKFAWRFFRSITGVGIEDLTSGFRLYRESALRELVSKRGTLLDYQDVGVLLLLQQADLLVTETKVKMAPRLFGYSHIYSSWLAVAYYMLVTTLLSLSKRKSFVVTHLT